MATFWPDERRKDTGKAAELQGLATRIPIDQPGRVVAIEFPPEHIVGNVLPNLVQRSFAADDVIVEPRLPGKFGTTHPADAFG